MHKPSFGKRALAIAMALGLAAGAPAGAVGPRNPERAAYAAMLKQFKRHVPHSAPKDGEMLFWNSTRRGPYRSARRVIRQGAALMFQKLMERRLSGRQWVRLRRSMKSGSVRGYTSLVARFSLKMRARGDA